MRGKIRRAILGQNFTIMILLGIFFFEGGGVARFWLLLKVYCFSLPSAFLRVLFLKYLALDMDGF